MVNYSTNNISAIEQAELFSARLLGMEQGVEDIITGCEQHPNEFILQLYCTILYAYGQNHACSELAQQHFQQAQNLCKHINSREQNLLTAVYHLLAKDYQKTIDILFLINQENRQDLLPAKIAEFCYYCLGQAFEAHQFVNYTTYLLPDNRHNADLLSMHSFALELTQQFEPARDYSMAALAINAQHPWAHHTLSHVYLRRKIMPEGIQALTQFKAFWPEKNAIIYCHNLWHLALLHLELMEIEDAWSIYQTLKNFDQTQVAVNIDLISLLWRLELAGKSATEEWAALANNIHTFAGEQYNPFLNAHFFYALARANQDQQAATALQQYQAFAEQQSGFYFRNWATVGQHLMRAILAFVNQEWANCGNLLRPYIGLIDCVGGSDAQADIFNQTYLVALINAKQWHEAKQYLQQRANRLPLTPLEHYWASQISNHG